MAASTAVDAAAAGTACSAALLASLLDTGAVASALALAASSAAASAAGDHELSAVAAAALFTGAAPLPAAWNGLGIRAM